MAEQTVLSARDERSVGVPEPGLRVVVAAAVCLVLYSYLGALWLNRHGYSPATLELIRAWVNKPAGVGEDFGVLGIALLLITGGYLLSATASRSVGSLAARLPVLVFPAVFVAVSLSAVWLAAGGRPLTDPAATGVTPAAYVANLLLVDRFAGQPALVALTWPIPVAAMFCLLLLGSIAVLRRPLLAATGQLVAIAVVVLLGARVSSEPLRELGLLAGFVPLAVLGELLWVARSGRAGTWPTGAVAIGAGAVVALTERLYRDWDGWWYPVTALYAVLIVLVALPAGRTLGHTPVVRWLTGRALWLVLLSGALGYALQSVQYQRVPLPLALVVGVGVTALAAEIGYRWVQRPLLLVADRITEGRGRRA